MFDVTTRFKGDKLAVDVLYTKTYEKSSDAYKVENYILKTTIDNKYKRHDILKGGNTELRVRPVANIEELVREAEEEMAVVLGFKKESSDKSES